jgi:energy-coupling factor transporter ATP-binding protein EcfA2
MMQVLQACRIEADIIGMPEGDAMLVTASGDNLSGGQRARINLARALYTEADIYLLDGVLAALDSQVSSSVLRSVLHGPLTSKSTVLLVTNHPIAVACADAVIELENGTLKSFLSQQVGTPNGRGKAQWDHVFTNVFEAEPGFDSSSACKLPGQASLGSEGVICAERQSGIAPGSDLATRYCSKTREFTSCDNGMASFVWPWKFVLMKLSAVRTTKNLTPRQEAACILFTVWTFCCHELSAAVEADNLFIHCNDQ